MNDFKFEHESDEKNEESMFFKKFEKGVNSGYWCLKVLGRNVGLSGGEVIKCNHSFKKFCLKTMNGVNHTQIKHAFMKRTKN